MQRGGGMRQHMIGTWLGSVSYFLIMEARKVWRHNSCSAPHLVQFDNRLLPGALR
jgi:hypothetical protein